MWTLFRRHASKFGRKSTPEPKDASEDGFARFKRANPDATYAQFYVSQVMRTLQQGKAHTTIGLRVRESDTTTDGVEHGWREAGHGPFLKYRKLCKLKPEQKLVDYGCGSLRLGVNFIEYLAAGNYMGLDVTRDFMEIGASAVPELIESKRPLLQAIDAASVQAATKFGADIVLSNAVSYHVHPDEVEAYLGNLAAICSKPGARLVFDVKLTESTVHFRSRGWAYPFDLYIERLKPLTLVRQHRVVTVKDYPDAPPMTSAILEFRRD